MKKVISGTPSIVINKDGIDESQLQKNNLDIGDLIESMRGAGYFCLDDVEYALYESNGSFSALGKGQSKQKADSMPVLMVCEGKFDSQNLALTGKSKEYYLSQLSQHGFHHLKNVLVMTVDGQGNVYAQEKGGKYKTFSMGWQERLW